MTIRHIGGDAAAEFQNKMEHLLPAGGRVVSSVTWVLYDIEGEPEQTLLVNPSCCTSHVLINTSTANKRIAEIIQRLILEETEDTDD